MARQNLLYEMFARFLDISAGDEDTRPRSRFLLRALLLGLGRGHGARQDEA
ncbi:MAG: hypothetical protein H5T70_07415 [Chloroflexi bacterium]|nr:hypothetical protein [Chloroflexota bacterium]